MSITESSIHVIYIHVIYMYFISCFNNPTGRGAIIISMSQRKHRSLERWRS